MMILAYLSASLAAALVLVMGLPGWPTREALFRLFIYWFFILVFTFAPAFLAITHAAASGTRSLWYYVVAGMGVTLFALLVSGFLLLKIFFPFAGNLGWLYALAKFVFAGVVGGFVFWGLVGRKCEAPSHSE